MLVWVVITCHPCGTPLPLRESLQPCLVCQPLIRIDYDHAEGVQVTSCPLTLHDFLQIQASDRDSEVNARITYSITGGDDLSQFGIDSTTGYVSVRKPIDREAVRQGLKSTELFIRLKFDSFNQSEWCNVGIVLRESPFSFSLFHWKICSSSVSVSET